MGTIHLRLACTLAMLPIFLGTIAATSQAHTPSGVVANAAVNNLNNAIGGSGEAIPKLKFDGQIQSAPTLFRDGKYAEAEPQFAWIAKVQKGTTWGERSQYYLAECQYRQKKYVEALESLERLHVDYPATDYIDELIRREYEIAQRFINWTKPPVLTGKKALLQPKVDEGPHGVNFEQLALRALGDVRQHQPSSPLAAEASIKLAEYYMAKGDYASAVAYYDQFVAEYRKHPLCPRARLGAAEARARIFLLNHRDTPGIRLVRELAKLYVIRFVR
jgi:TolA-binding protein